MKLTLSLAAAWLFLLAFLPARASDAYSFAEGAHGFLIHDYNEKLAAHLRPLFADRVREPKDANEFDAATTENTRLLQSTIEAPHAPPGRAGPGRGGWRRVMAIIAAA